jgi:hypothetical protein
LTRRIETARARPILSPIWSFVELIQQDVEANSNRARRPKLSWNCIKILTFLKLTRPEMKFLRSRNSDACNVLY